jgi:hypothetical protein
MAESREDFGSTGGLKLRFWRHQVTQKPQRKDKLLAGGDFTSSQG